jgi:putative Ca2+/H+ antiporter (TMEM165/GDT1 family)
VDLAIIATVFPIISIGELPEKTMIASLVMSTQAGRYRSGSVLLGPSSYMW